MKKPYIYSLISILMWSTLATSAKLLLDNFTNFQVLCVSSLIAAIVLLIMNIVSGKIKVLKNYKLMDWIKTILAGIPGIFLYHIFYYAGADILPASQAFIINYLWPVMSIIFACILLKEKMTIRKAVALLVSFAGVILVTGSGISEVGGLFASGAIFCSLGAVSYGLFTVLNQMISYDKCISMMINFAVSFILAGIVVVAKDGVFMPNGTQLLGLLWNGIITLAVPNTLWIIALEKRDTAKISNLAYITPFVSLIWARLILKEELRPACIFGLVIIVLGIFIQLKDRRNTVKSNNLNSTSR